MPEFMETCPEFGNCCLDNFNFIAIEKEKGLNPGVTKELMEF